MELGRRIRERRGELGLSQDDLATRVYVSRQTISSWENDKTYPDVQSLLILSDVFGVTIDILIKGDVEAMTKTVEHDAKLILRLGWAMLGAIALMLAAMGWFTVQYLVWDWDFAQCVPTLVLTAAIWGVCMFATFWADKIKKSHDLLTYQEITAFVEGKPIERDTERRRREELMPRWMKTVRTASLIAIALAIGFVVGYQLAALLNTLLA